MTEDPDAKESHIEAGSKTYTNKARDKKSRVQRPLTKIVLRRLPPTMTEETFLEQVSPIPEHDHFYFAKPDPSLGNNNYSRAYINFVNVDDIYLFRDKFDGYVFLDDKGMEYVGIVEYAPFQRIPKKKKKKDPKCGTIESDPVYQEFLDSLNDQDTDNQPKLEYSYPVNEVTDKKAVSTPLLEYLAARKQDKRSRDERRRRENDKRKMRILKSKEGPIKKSELSEEERSEDGSDSCDYTSVNNCWFGEQRIYHKSKVKHELKNSSSQESDEFMNKEMEWDSFFPALSMKTHNTFTLTSGVICEKNNIFETNEKSAGDTQLKTYLEEDLADTDIKKTKPRDWDKEKPRLKDEQVSPDDKDGIVFETKTYREQRKSTATMTVDKKKKYDNDKKETIYKDNDLADEDTSMRKEKKDKFKESPRETKSKKYSDTRKERFKQNETAKCDKSITVSKHITSSSQGIDKVIEVKLTKSLNSDDIKPFTQLPQVKTEDLTKVIEEMDRKMKLGEQNAFDAKIRDSVDERKDKIKKSTESKIEPRVMTSHIRRNSLESGEINLKDDSQLKRQNSLDDSSKSSREDSVEKEKNDNTERRSEKRIRNKDRPSIVIYQPGMGKFSKQRLAKEKDSKNVNESEKKDT